MTVVYDVEFALSKRIPQLDGTISGRRDDLTIIGRERDARKSERHHQSQPNSQKRGLGKHSRQHIPGMSHEYSRCQTRVKIPQPQRLVP